LLESDIPLEAFPKEVTAKYSPLGSIEISNRKNKIKKLNELKLVILGY